MIATANNTVVKTIPVGEAPNGVAITPNGNFAYVTNQGSNTVSVIATANNTVVGTIPVACSPFRAAITPNGKFVYVTTSGCEADSPQLLGDRHGQQYGGEYIPRLGRLFGMAITPNGKFAYMSGSLWSR